MGNTESYPAIGIPVIEATFWQVVRRCSELKSTALPTPNDPIVFDKFLPKSFNSFPLHLFYKNMPDAPNANNFVESW